MMIRTLTEAVRLTTGLPDAAPRPGQLTLTEHIEAAIRTTGQVIGVAPTGLGKSYALLAPAMVAAAELGQRTIISTESLALLSQILNKDSVVAADACEKVTGTRPAVAMLKGFSNYVCGVAARDTAEAITGTPGQRLSLRALSEKVGKLPRTGNAHLDGRPFDLEAGVPLLLWALGLAEDAPGDKQTYPGKLTPELWDTVSIGPSECIGDSCPIFELCKPRGARAKAAEADIVVTNHSMLAVQAAKGVPVIIGNKTLGEFHIIMIDEAHTLPANVRNAGAAEISASTVNSLARAIGRVLDDNDRQTSVLIRTGEVLATELQSDLDAMAAGTPAGEVFKVKEDADPLERLGDVLIEWARSVKNALEPAGSSSDTKLRLKAKRLSGRLDAFIGSVGDVKLHKVGTARWIELKTPPATARNQVPYWAANASPVNIGGLLQANLWTAPVIPDEEDPVAVALKEAGEPAEPGEVEKYPMTVIAVSATLPARFGYQVGMTAPNVEYPSPFDASYGKSKLYVAKVEPHELEQMYPGWRDGGGRARFNTKLHMQWAARKNAKLVDANCGSALILSANSEAGKLYTETLRRAAKGRWKVYSQWDGLSAEQVVSLWRDDERSVLVGTRSLMTGVDAKGRTCSLVSIDRVPRAAGNPVDDARVEAYMEALQIDKWAADRMVYASDAALLLEQAAGRLIRAVSDFGLVAILDPRFLKTGPVTYKEQTRAVYKAAVKRFLHVTTKMTEAEAFLDANAKAHLALAA
jgi:ATP-dependent DNA helicase DinG